MIGGAAVVAAVLLIHGAHSSVPPKFIRAAYGVQKALYAKDYGYSLLPIPTQILRQAHPPSSLPIVGEHPIISSRQGRAYKYYRGGPRSKYRRRKRPVSKRRRPSSYGVPVYATKYKNYVPSRRPPKPYRYKKRRPYRGPVRRPPPYVHSEFDEYEQEIDDYDDYDHRDGGDYSYFDGVPSKRLPLEYDKEFLNRHADLYNGGYNPGLPRGRFRDAVGQYTDQVRTRVRYHPPKEEHVEHQEKPSEEASQETLWPGEVSNVQSQEHPWHDVHAQAQESWQDDSSSQWGQSQEWNHPRPPRQDNQWQVYNAQQPQAQQAQPQQHLPQFHWPPRPTRAQDLRGWTTSLRPKPLSAAVAVPSRTVTPREQEPSNHRPVYNWDSATNTYHLVEHDSRPRYQSHYSEADFNYDQYRRSHDTKTDRKSGRSHRAFSEPDIGFGEGMEVVDDGVAGWKVKK